MYFYEPDKNLKIYLHYFYFHTEQYRCGITHYYPRSYMAYMETVVVNGQNELVIYSLVFLGHIFFPCCSSAVHRRYMSALTRDRQFQEEGNCHLSIQSMNIYSGPKMCYSWGSLLSITEMNEARVLSLHVTHPVEEDR